MDYRWILSEAPVISSWEDLRFWNSGECQVIDEYLKDLDGKGYLFCPNVEPFKPTVKRFSKKGLLPIEKIRVLIVGQDPYPNPKMATGIAFSIPKEVKQLDFPPTLVNLFNEYREDLHYPFPQSGDLTPWTKQGVMLWNYLPSCTVGKSLSHNWDEYHYLTKEIIEELDKLGKIIFVFLGGYARRAAQYVTNKDSLCLEWSHPSPRASLKSNRPFIGSRMFSTINGKLVEQGLGQIDWRLP